MTYNNFDWSLYFYLADYLQQGLRASVGHVFAEKLDTTTNVHLVVIVYVQHGVQLVVWHYGQTADHVLVLVLIDDGVFIWVKLLEQVDQVVDALQMYFEGRLHQYVLQAAEGDMVVIRQTADLLHVARYLEPGR